MRELLPLLATLRRQTGLPHKILVDEAHYYLGEPDGRHLLDAELAGYILVTYRVSGIDRAGLRRRRHRGDRDARDGGAGAGHAARLVRGQRRKRAGRRLPESHSQRSRAASGRGGIARRDSAVSDRPAADRACAAPHEVPRHADCRAAGLRVQQRWPARAARPDAEGFRRPARRLPDAELLPYVRRHDFSRWLEHVFRDCPLATHVKAIECRVATDRAAISSTTSPRPFARVRNDTRGGVGTGGEHEQPDQSH